MKCFRLLLAPCALLSVLDTGSAHAQSVEYTVQIHTKKIKNGGTNGALEIQLIGSGGTSAPVVRDDHGIQHNGKTATIPIRCDESIGEVYAVKLTLVKVPKDAWCAGWVSVSKENNPSSLQYSVDWGGKWLGSREGGVSWTQERPGGKPRDFTVPVEYPKHPTFKTWETITILPPGTETTDQNSTTEADEVTLEDEDKQFSSNSSKVRVDAMVGAQTPSIKASLRVTTEQAKLLEKNSLDSAKVNYQLTKSQTASVTRKIPENVWEIRSVQIWESQAVGSQTYGKRKILIKKSPVTIRWIKYDTFDFNTVSDDDKAKLARAFVGWVNYYNKHFPSADLRVPENIKLLLEESSLEAACFVLPHSLARNEASLEFPKKVKPGEEFTVKFKGDSRCEDTAFIAFVDGDEESDDALECADFEEGDTYPIGKDESGEVELEAPEEEGTYTIRIFTAADGKSICKETIEVEGEPVPDEVDEPDEVDDEMPPPVTETATPILHLAKTTLEAGEEFTIEVNLGDDFTETSWVGIVPKDTEPDNEEDNKEAALAKKVLLKAAGSIKLTAPKEAGTYHIRVFGGDPLKHLKTITINVEESARHVK